MSSVSESDAGELKDADSGIMVMPGTYKIYMSKSVNGEITQVTDTVKFDIEMLNNRTLPPEDESDRLAFQEKVSDLSMALNAARRTLGNLEEQAAYFKAALKSVNRSTTDIYNDILEFEDKLEAIQTELNGDRTKSRLDMDQEPSITNRVFSIVFSYFRYTGEPTETMQRQYQVAADQFEPVYDRLKTIVNTDLPRLQQKMDEIGAPWTPGRLPDWKK